MSVKSIIGHYSQNLLFLLRNGKKSVRQKKVDFWSLRLIVDGLGQDQQLHPAVHTGGVSRGRVRGCGCWR